MSLRILLVRHGLSSFNLEHRIQGRDDLSSLTEAGLEQARTTGAALAELQLDAAYSSPLRRARDTANTLLLAQGLGTTAGLAWVAVASLLWPLPLAPFNDQRVLVAALVASITAVLAGR